MQEKSSTYEAERLQRAVLALALYTYPSHLPRRQVSEEIGEGEPVAAAIRFLVRARLLRWEDEALAVTASALAFDRLGL